MTVVVVLVPAALRHTGVERARFISRVFPYVFRTASVLAGLTLAAGAALNYQLTGGWRQLDEYFASARHGAILVGGLLGLVLAVFHFVVEGRLEGRVRSLESADEAQLGRISRFLRLVPWVGLAVLLAIFVLMMIGARGT